jgi:hypothetical protein
MDEYFYQKKGYSDGFKEGRIAGLKFIEKIIGLGTQAKMEMNGEIGNIFGKKVLISKFIPNDTIIFGTEDKPNIKSNLKL